MSGHPFSLVCPDTGTILLQSFTVHAFMDRTIRNIKYCKNTLPLDQSNNDQQKMKHFPSPSCTVHRVPKRPLFASLCHQSLAPNVLSDSMIFCWRIFIGNLSIYALVLHRGTCPLSQCIKSKGLVVTRFVDLIIKENSIYTDKLANWTYMFANSFLSYVFPT